MIRLILACLLLSFCLVGCGNSNDEIFDPTQSHHVSQSDQFVSVDGQTVRYRETGRKDAPAVVLLHGFTDSLQTWDGLAEQLGEDFRVIRPDLPGHGLSGPAPNGDYSNVALVAFVGDFLDAAQVEQPVLVGNSLGGLAAWRFAASNPDAVSGLVLLSPGGVPHNGIADVPIAVPAMLSFYLKKAPETGVRAALSSMHVDKTLVTDERVDQFWDLMQTPGNGEAFVARAGAFTLPDPTEDMQRIKVPTAIIWGAQDNVLPVAHAEIFATNVPNADVIILENVGHMPQSEAVERVANTIRGLARREGN